MSRPDVTVMDIVQADFYGTRILGTVTYIDGTFIKLRDDNGEVHTRFVQDMRIVFKG